MTSPPTPSRLGMKDLGPRFRGNLSERPPMRERADGTGGAWGRLGAQGAAGSRRQRWQRWQDSFRPGAAGAGSLQPPPLASGVLVPR